MWPMNKYPRGAPGGGGNNKYEESGGLPLAVPRPCSQGTLARGGGLRRPCPHGPVGRTLIRVDLAIL